MPQLKGKLDGYSMRVPTPNVSVVDLVAVTSKSTTAEEVNAALKAAAEGELKGILAYTEDPGGIDRHDAQSQQLHRGLGADQGAGRKPGEGIAWYDNEWGYSMRVVDLAIFLAKKDCKTASFGRGSESASVEQVAELFRAWCVGSLR